MNFTKSEFWAITVSEDGIGFTEVYLFKFSSLPVLGESSFKAPIVTLEEYVYHWNVHSYNFCTKTWLCIITFSENESCTLWILLISFGFIVSIKGKFF